MPAPLTRSQRARIVGGVAGFVVAALTLRFFLLESPGLGDVLASAVWCAGLLVLLPFFVERIDRTHAYVVPNLAYAAAGGLIAVLAAVSVERMPPTATPLRDALIIYLVGFGSALQVSAATTAIVRAVYWYRRTVELNDQRMELEAEEARRTRQLVEEHFRPRITVAMLERIAAEAKKDRERATMLLFRLARYERHLLSRAPERSASRDIALPGDDSFAPKCPPPPRLFHVLLMLLLYAAAFIFSDLQWVGEGDHYWSRAATSGVSVALWLVVGPVLAWVLDRVASLPYRLAVCISVFAIFAAIGLVMVASLAVVSLLVRVPLASLFGAPVVLPSLLLRNSFLALTFGATAVAVGFGRQLLRASDAAVRARDEVAQAETRALEARYHPHFLLNALSSIVELLRTDAEAAAAMTLRLAQLVQKTVDCAGLQFWTLRAELDLASDYMAVQAMRFQSRLIVDSWDIGAGSEASFPRLILQPLIENAFKHGVARSAEATRVGLTISETRKALTLTIWNDAADAQVPRSPGRGLTFVMRRVEAAGGTVSIDTPENRQFRVRCTIPLRRNSGQFAVTASRLSPAGP